MMWIFIFLFGRVKNKRHKFTFCIISSFLPIIQKVSQTKIYSQPKNKPRLMSYRGREYEEMWDIISGMTGIDKPNKK